MNDGSKTLMSGYAQVGLPKLAEPTPTVHMKYEQLTKAIDSLRNEIDMIDERLGHVSTPQPGKYDPNEIADAPASDSPMAHNLHVATSQINSLAFRLQAMRGNLEI